MADTLHELGIKYHTDKAVYHQFTVWYDFWLSHLRREPIRMLEIGILLGGSLRMWHEYFERPERIFAADLLFPEERGVEAIELGPRVELLRLDQSDRQQLAGMPRRLDLVIDDGGHRMEQQQLSLVTLFEHLKPGGIYILEDLHTSQPRYAASHGSTIQNNTLRLLEDLRRGQCSKNSEYFLTPDEFSGLCAQIQDIEIVKIKADSITARIRRRAECERFG
jgi:hypothetical protein